MKKSMLFLTGLALAATWTSPSAAQTAPATQSGGGTKGAALYEILPDGNISPTPDNPQHPEYMRQQIAFRAAANVRRDAYVGFSNGANVMQQGKSSFSNDMGSVSDNLKSSVGFISGMRGGYTWQLGDAEVKDNLLALTLEGELLYSYTPGIRGSYADEDSGEPKKGKNDIHIFALMTNPILRFQLGEFVPYVGVGFGGALVLAADPVEGTAGRLIYSDSRYGMALAFQGMVGFDYYFNKLWSLFTEYKYLGLYGIDFNKRLDSVDTNSDFKIDGIYGNHIVTVGIKYHF